MSFRLNDIRNFVETSSCKTLTQAAQKLEMSQPALSESLKRLEADAKITLFYRSRQGINLTPSGREFLEKSLSLMNAYQELEADLDKNLIFGNQSITIGCHATVAQYSLPKALAMISDEAPDFKINLKHDLSRNIQSEVQRGNIDIGIVINPTEVPDLVIRKLAVDLVSVWSGTSAPLDCVICNLDLFQTQSILKKWKNKPKKVISTDSLELICKLTHEKIGFGIIPEQAVRLSGLKLNKQTLLPAYKDEVSLIYRPEFGKTKAEKLVIEALRKSFSNLKT